MRLFIFALHRTDPGSGLYLQPAKKTGRTGDGVLRSISKSDVSAPQGIADEGYPVGRSLATDSDAAVFLGARRTDLTCGAEKGSKCKKAVPVPPGRPSAFLSRDDGYVSPANKHSAHYHAALTGLPTIMAGFAPGRGMNFCPPPLSTAAE